MAHFVLAAAAGGVCVCVFPYCMPLQSALQGAPVPSDNDSEGNTHDASTFISIKNPFSYILHDFPNQRERGETPK